MWAAIVVMVLVACGSSGGDGGGPDAREPDATTQLPSAPPASAGHALVYHDALERVLLVNAGLGGTVSPPQNEPTRLWAWDGSAWSLLDSSGPPVRNLGGVAYDPAREVLVLHGGGYSATVSYGDTWEWKAGRGWMKADVTGPGVRDHTQMAYDGARGKIVLFGGQRTLTMFPRDVWTWDGAMWQSESPAGPSARVHHAMEYDPAAAAVIVYGGYEPSVRDHGDTWAWNGVAWTELGTEGPPRTHARMAYDENLSALVLVGGASAADVPMVRRPTGWEPLAVPGAPSPRYLTAVAFDKHRHVLVVYGGGDARTDALLGDTWELAAGTQWSRRP